MREERASFRSCLPGGDGEAFPHPGPGQRSAAVKFLTKTADVTEEYAAAGEALRLFEKYGCCLAILMREALPAEAVRSTMEVFLEA